MDSGVVLLGCTFHQANGKRWVNPPGRPQLDSERKQIIGGDGKVAYAPVIEFVDPKTRFRWSAQAVAALEEYLESKEPATQAGSMNNESTPEAANQGRQGG
jgi:hypothetical protein